MKLADLHFPDFVSQLNWSNQRWQLSGDTSWLLVVMGTQSPMRFRYYIGSSYSQVTTMSGSTMEPQQRMRRKFYLLFSSFFFFRPKNLSTHFFFSRSKQSNFDLVYLTNLSFITNSLLHPDLVTASQLATRARTGPRPESVSPSCRAQS